MYQKKENYLKTISANATLVNLSDLHTKTKRKKLIFNILKF